MFRSRKRIPGLYEAIAHPDCLVPYRVAATHIEVINIAHVHRQFPAA